MRRRLPFEPVQLVAELTAWIEWRHAGSRYLVLTGAPSSLPRLLERWMPEAVWRLAWLKNGVAVLYGLAPSGNPGKYFVVKHDAANVQREGVFEHLPDGTWRPTEGDDLHPDTTDVLRKVVVNASRSRRAARQSRRQKVAADFVRVSG